MKLVHSLIYPLLITMLTIGVLSLSLTHKLNMFKEEYRELSFKVVRDALVVGAPFSGQVASVLVEPGQQVAKGEALLVLESLHPERKYELTLTAPRSARVGAIEAVQGTYVKEDDAIMKLEAVDEVAVEAEVNWSQLRRLQKLGSLSVYSPRLQNSYTVRLVNFSVVEASEGTSEEAQTMYKVRLEPNDNEVALSLENNEVLEFYGTNPNGTTRPADIVATIWNSILE